MLELVELHRLKTQKLGESLVNARHYSFLRLHYAKEIDLYVMRKWSTWEFIINWTFQRLE